MLPFDLTTALLMFATMFVATFIGATTGGSALLTTPLAIFLGFNPAVAIATTKVGVLGSTGAGWLAFNKQNSVSNKIGLIAAIFACCGAVVGAHLMALMPVIVLRRIIGGIILFILLITILRRTNKINIAFHAPTIWWHLAGYIGFFIVGVLGGIFGGQGIMSIYILLFCFQLDYLHAAGTRLIIAFGVAAVAIVVYQLHHLIDWSYAGIFLVATISGSYFGSNYGLRRGEKWAQNLFAVVVVLMSVRLLW